MKRNHWDPVEPVSTLLTIWRGQRNVGSTLLQKARLDPDEGGPDPVRLLRALANSLRAAAEFHEPRIADVLRRAADDMMRRSREIGTPADGRTRSLAASWKIALRMLDEASD